MPLDFPANPSVNDTYSFGGKTWRWNGSGWQLNTGGGAINDIPIGNVTPSTGAFTALSATGNVTAGNVLANAYYFANGDPFTSGGSNVDLTAVASDITPTANVTYDIGSTSLRFRDIYLANSTIHLGSQQISANGNGLVLPDTVQIGNATIDGSSGGLILPGDTSIGGATAATPRITSIDYPGDDTAADPAGGQTLGIVGSGFFSGVTVILDGVTISPVTLVSSTRVEITAPAKSAGSYTLYVINSDGGTGIFVPGVQYSGVPVWSSPSAGSLGTVYETANVAATFSATSDSSVTYSLLSGTLPAGSSLDANTGVLSGTANLIAGSSVTYSFTVRATDAENQDTDRAFSLTVDADSVTWSSPAAGDTVSITVDQVSTTTLNAVSAAGDSITYSANALPSGLTLTGNTISGTANTVANTSVALTATADTTTRSATIAVTFVVALPLGDEYFRQTTLVLNGDTDTFITDASDNAFTITPNGDTRPSAFSPYNTRWSNYFDGTDEYLAVQDDASLDFGAGDFTIEFWEYRLFAKNDVAPLQRRINISGSSNHVWTVAYESNGALNSYFDNGAGTIYLTLASGTARYNQWVHRAYCRSGNTVYAFENGVLIASGALTQTLPAGSAALSIGRMQSGYDFPGYLSNVRLVKGTAVYTSNFTPPTEPLTAISGTSLLTCQSNRFRDASTNNFTITRNGDVKVTAFAPFTDTDTSTGSSLYVSDATDACQIADNDNLSFTSTDDFTLECWVYHLGHRTYNYFFSKGLTTTREYGFGTSGSYMLFYWQQGGDRLTGHPYTFLLNTWYHLAYTNTGGNLRYFINGELVKTEPWSGVITNTVHPAWIGSFLNYRSIAHSFYGYLSDLRFIKGEALYTSSFDVPTAPRTNETNTQLLTHQSRISYNNSQPIDESGIRNIITRNGNASAGTFSPHVPTGWSTYFNGSQYIPHSAGTYAKWCGGTNTGFAGKTWTIETWINPERFSSSAATSIVGRYAGVAANGRWVFYLNVSSTNSSTIGLVWTTSTGTQTQVLSTGTISKFEWSHIAVTIDATTSSSSTVKFYINGILDSTHTGQNFSSQTAFYDEPWIAGGNQYFDYFKGYLHGFRVLQGELLAFGSVPTEPPQPVDKTVYLNFRSNQIVDDSANRCTFTAAGSITPFSPFAPNTITPDSYSVYFDGTGDYLNTTTISGEDIAGDFTIECWVFLPNVSGIKPILDARSGNNASAWTFYINGSNIEFYPGFASALSFAAGLTANTWTHISIVRSGTSLTCYKNGTSISSQTLSSSMSASGTTYKIGNYGSAEYFSGYLSNLRFVNGTAIVPPAGGPTENLTAVTNTVLLTCQSPTIIDNSVNEFVITVNGNSQPTRFNPFGETVTTGVEYSPVLHGGSVYFDGTGDYLTLTTGNDFALGTADFTIECWVYVENLSSERAIFYKYVTWTSNTDISLRINANGSIRFLAGDNIPVDMTSSAGVIRTYSWNHIAVTRSGNSFRQFVNGIPAGTDTESTSIQNDKTTMHIGSDTNGTSAIMHGYIHGLRILKGTCLYTAAFVPPMDPATALPGEILLLNGTNAAIQDRTGRNVLQTVGNARVINGVRKFGSGAMSFDGAGYCLLMNGGENFAFGTGDFTIECWIYFSSTAGVQVIYDQRPISTNGAYPTIYWDGSGIVYYANNSNQITGGALSASTWYHLAVSRSGTSTKMFINGTQVGSTYTDSTVYLNPTNRPAIGFEAFSGSQYYFNGYIDDLRITRGVARYTTNFTPPTATFELK